MVIGSGAQVDSTSASLDRAGRNVWWLRLTDPRQPTPPIVDDFETLLPSDALARWSESGLEGDAIAVKVELDVCGAWLTVANAGDARPVLVRRAGWVELRGHPSPPLGGQWIGSDDRIGLGPADMLLVPVGSGRRNDGDTDNKPLDALLDRSLRAAGTDPTELLRAVGEIAQGERCVGDWSAG